MAEFLFLGVALALKAVMNINEPEPIRFVTNENRSLHHEVRQMREDVDQKRRDVDKLIRKTRKMEIKSFNDLSKREERRKQALVNLARRTETTKRQGNNIGIFGLTSTGKSTMVNSLLGKKVADTGVGETTKEITPYQGTHYTLWDAPGRNDELTYSNEKYISFIKGLSRRLILIQYTIKENLQLMRLLDNLELGYDIIVNKFDDVDEDERKKFQGQIQREITSFGLKRKKNVFFLSAQYPRMFSNWLKMVDYLTEECIDYDGHTDTETDSDSSETSDSD